MFKLKPPLGGFFMESDVKTFFLNFSRIIESNPKVYWSIIVGIVACVFLFIAEIIHVQHVVNSLAPNSREQLAEIIPPLSQKYTWSRVMCILLAIFGSIYQYRKTKQVMFK
jgi:hypothetical protein